MLLAEAWSSALAEKVRRDNPNTARAINFFLMLHRLWQKCMLCINLHFLCQIFSFKDQGLVRCLNLRFSLE
jgi:hypothetical protein